MITPEIKLCKFGISITRCTCINCCYFSDTLGKCCLDQGSETAAVLKARSILYTEFSPLKEQAVHL